jgi:hypothetical protein
MDHLTSKLGAAGLVDVALMATTTAAAQLTIHTEKAAHITSKLSAAGLDTGTGTSAEVKDTNTGSTTQNSTAKTASSHHLTTATIIIIAVVGALVLLSAMAGIFFAIKRRQRRYNAVGGKQKGVMVTEKDVFNADLHEPETEGLQQQEAGLRERNFESGYDNVDSHYDGSDYEVKPTLGDKRSQYGA